jgi:diguanylate cyclase (GGDEF)-like protein
MNVLFWRCRDQLERRRLLDMSRRLRPAKIRSFALLGLAAAVAAPRFGWGMELPLLAAAGLFAASQLLVGRVRRPEDLLAATWFLAVLAIFGAIALAQGPRIYTLPIMIVPTLLAASVFPGRVVAAGAALTIATMVGAAFAFIPEQIENLPAVITYPVTIVIVIAMLAARTIEAEEESRHKAALDPLTGLPNRNALQARVAEIVHADGEAHGAELGVLVADIDHLKEINDRRGHAAGDEVIMEVARRLARTSGRHGELYRFGGEEFVMLVEPSDAKRATELAEQLRASVADTAVDGTNVTVSVGVALPAGAVRDYPRLFSLADHALYRAKADGRNCVRAAPADADTTWSARLGRRGDRRESLQLRLAPENGAHLQPAFRAAGGSLLMPTQADRDHMLDMIERTRTINKFADPLIAATLLSAAPWFGWPPLIPVGVSLSVLAVVGYGVVPRVRRPEYPMLAALMLLVVGIGTATLMARHDAMFTLPFFTVLAFSNAAGSPARVAIGQALTTGLVMCAVALLLNADMVAANPSVLTFPLALLCIGAMFGYEVGRAALDQHALASVDHLTGAMSRTALRKHVAAITASGAAAREPFSLLAIDIDHFKRVNDGHGHHVGDSVLVAVCERFRESLRPMDDLYRLGGEEFLVVLEDLNEADAIDVAERIREAVLAHPCAGIDVTVSVGVCGSAAGEPFDFDALVSAADRSLYAAKAAGRDRVVASRELVPPSSLAA